MNDAAGVRVRQGHGQLLNEFSGLARRLRLPGDAFRQGAARDEFQRQEGQTVEFADLVNLHDAGMPQAGDGVGLRQEARRRSGPACPPARIIFRAASRPGCVCRALYTTLMPPRPSSARIV